MVKKLFESDKNSHELWQSMCKQYNLSQFQAQQFEQFAHELLAWNKKMNLTAITDISALLRDHFQDSLVLTSFVSFNSNDSVCDVGSGGGFPGIPLKILYPELPMVLLEVNQKKVTFLQAMIKALKLSHIQVCSLDFRTFIRQAPFAVTYFLARASLRPDELLRALRPSSPYKGATIIYWASGAWEIGDEEKIYLDKIAAYSLDHKERKLVFFKAKTS